MPDDARSDAGSRESRGGTGLAGIDGCPGGWFCVTERAGSVHGFVASGFAEALRQLDGIAVIAIDMPIGLPQAGPRDCDMLARQRLGPRRGASVFPAPLRPVLAAADYAQACALRERIEGRAMSRQAWNIVPKVREVDGVVRRIGQARVHEVHPEVSFAALAGRPMRLNKKRAAGRDERLALLQQVFSTADLNRELSARRYRQVGSDDVIDAFICLWSARRIHGGSALRLPAEPQRDDAGLDMAIWA